MFVLARMQDIVRIAPHEMGVQMQTALTRALNRKLANKVFIDVGLCIALYDFESIADSFILPGDGASHTKVQFRMCVFCPFVDEIIVGRVRANSRAGVHLTLEFFDDILVPADKLPTPSRFDESEQVWYWEYADDDEDTTSAPAKLYLDAGKQVRFRVVELRFTDTAPSGAPSLDSNTETQTQQDTNKPTPLTIIATMGESGLGCLDWWAPEAEPDAATAADT